MASNTIMDKYSISLILFGLYYGFQIAAKKNKLDNTIFFTFGGWRFVSNG
jgi:hypothetical protein